MYYDETANFKSDEVKMMVVKPRLFPDAEQAQWSGVPIRWKIIIIMIKMMIMIRNRIILIIAYYCK